MPKIEQLSGTKQHTVYRTSDGKRVPGTTTIIGVLNKPQLVKWANQLGLQGIDSTKYVDKLATVGTIAHYMVECHCLGSDPILDAYSAEEVDRAENSYLSFLEWEKDKEIEYLHNELILVDDDYAYGGTIDIYCKINGKLTLADIKTSKAIYDEHLIQLAAYKNLLEANGYPVDEVRVLRIGRSEDEGFEERRTTDLAAHWKLFKHLREVYELQKLIRRKAG